MEEDIAPSPSPSTSACAPEAETPSRGTMLNINMDGFLPSLSSHPTSPDNDGNTVL